MKAALEDDIVYLNTWLGEMADEVADAKLEANEEGDQVRQEGSIRKYKIGSEET